MLEMKILEEASKQNLTQGRSPGGVAAACIYLIIKITNDRLTQQDIAIVAQVTEVTTIGGGRDLEFQGG
jgi:transcription initiation factor TFIIB